jgi:hypothetical protein
MKSIIFKNRLNSERVICDNPYEIDVIDGVEYLIVHRINEQRLFKMRRDALVKDSTVIKESSQKSVKI